MAVQVIPQYDSGEKAGETLGTILAGYTGYRMSKAKKEKAEEKKKKEQSELSKALQLTYNFSKDKADAASKMEKNILSQVLKSEEEKKLTGRKTAKEEKQISNTSRVLQGIGYSKENADVLASSGSSVLSKALSASYMIPGGLNVPAQEQQVAQGQPQQQDMGLNQLAGMQQQQQPQEPSQDPYAQQQQEQLAAAQQAVSPQGLSETGTKRPDIPFSPDETKEFRSMIAQGIKSKEINKKEAGRILDLIGVDKATKKVIFGKKLNKDIGRYFMNLANGDPDKARQLAKEFGYRS